MRNTANFAALALVGALACGTSTDGDGGAGSPSAGAGAGVSGEAGNSHAGRGGAAAGRPAADGGMGGTGSGGAGSGGAGAGGEPSDPAGRGGAPAAEGGSGGAAAGSGAEAGGREAAGGAGAGGAGSGGAGSGGAGSGGAGSGAAGSGGAGAADVLQHHNLASRSGVYIAETFTKSAVATLHLDTGFSATIDGPSYAQPLYLRGATTDQDSLIVVTEQNYVYALAPATGAVRWTRMLGDPLPRSYVSGLKSGIADGCGNIDPIGITGTPAIDAATRTIYLDAMIMTNAEAHHQVFALDADSGDTRTGWPVDLNANAHAGGTNFDSLVQNQRGGLILLNGQVFVPFGGHGGDCGTYHGWVIGISTSDPTQVSAWATRGIGGGIWAPGGLASDGASLYFATGNTEAMENTFLAPDTWQDGEAIFRLPPSLVFSGQSADYFAPPDWTELDDGDLDISGSNPLLLDVPGATPSSLVIGLGKNGQAYLLDRANLGGIAAPLASTSVSTDPIIGAPVTYTTANGTYVVFKNFSSCPLRAIKVSGTPPSVAVDWCGDASAVTRTAPAVSMTDENGSDAIVWIMSSNNELLGLDGETGAVLRHDTTLFDAGDNGEPTHVLKFQTPIIVAGRMYFAANARVLAWGL